MLQLFISKIISTLRFYCMPSICVECKIFLPHVDALCASCVTKIFPIVSKEIQLTASISMTVFALSDYKDPLRKLILAKSWADSAAGYHMGNLLWKMSPVANLDYDVVVPIPLHWRRYAWRGFNQSQEIARVISKKKGVAMRHLLKRVKHTVYQSAVASKMRESNVRDAFVLNQRFAQEYEGKHILLIDDLMTTGATLRAAGKALLELKPKKISIAVVCRVI